MAAKLVLFFFLLTATPLYADNFPNIASWDFTLDGEGTLCDGNNPISESDGPIQLAQTSPGYCVCSGQAAPVQMVHGGTKLDGGNMFCTPTGWRKLYPIDSPEACPQRINRYRPPPNGCGSAGMGWVPQTYLGIVAIDHYICDPHDRAYSDCGTSKQQADDQWRRDSEDICGRYFSNNSTLYTGCIRQTEAYRTAFVVGGGDAWQAAQREACQCGPYSPCMGGQAQGCINCPPMVAASFPRLPLLFPPVQGCSPGDDFC